MPFVTVRDIQIYYEVRGTGERLLYIGGTGGDLRQRPSIFDSPLADRFEILAYDQRGLGQTDRPDIPYTMADYAMDANGLLAAVGWDRCFVMGVSFGGMVAQEVAIRFPGRVERLVLACTSSGGTGGRSFPLHEFGGLTPREKALGTVLLSDTRRDAAWQAAHPQKLQALVDQVEATLLVGADEPGRNVGTHRQIEARRGHDTYDRLPTLRMPVFICGGRYDGIAPTSNLEEMYRQIPQARFELFEGGHLFLLQDPNAFVRVSVFLEGTLDGDRREAV